MISVKRKEFEILVKTLDMPDEEKELLLKVVNPLFDVQERVYAIGLGDEAFNTLMSSCTNTEQLQKDIFDHMHNDEEFNEVVVKHSCNAFKEALSKLGLDCNAEELAAMKMLSEIIMEKNMKK